MQRYPTIKRHPHFQPLEDYTTTLTVKDQGKGIKY